jgi:two-component system, response regulator / RNA-binding antiterminator
MPRVLIFYDPPAQPEPVRFALLGSGYSVVDEIDDAAKLKDRATAIGPAIVIAICITPKPALQAALQALDRENPHPVLLYTQDPDQDKIEQAARAGVASYIVDGFSAKRIRTQIDVAVARFKVVQHLKRDLKTATDKLEERKLVERAKGILMQVRGMREEEAYQALRKMAMDKGQPMATVADNVINMAKLLAA